MPIPSDNRGILFLHEAAARNGSPMALLHLLRWLKSNTERPFSLLLSYGGPLFDDFQSVATVRTAESSHWCPGGIRSQALRLAGLGPLARRNEAADLRRFASACRPALMYANSFAKSNFNLIELLQLDLPLITHVHEMEFLLRVQSGSPSIMKPLIERTHRFIAASDAVKNNLVQNHGVAPDKVETVHEYIPVAQVRSERSRSDIFNELGIPTEDFLIVASGFPGWVKGTDLFIRLVRTISQTRSDVHFAWVGGKHPSIELFAAEVEAERMGIREKIRFIQTSPRPADYFAAADVFVLTSREDSYPLVCLEAAALSKPIICFERAGGMPEFVEQDCGFVVPYLDTEAMADRVARLLDCPQCRIKMGEAARAKVAKRHDVSLAGRRISEIIEGVIQNAVR